MNIPTTKAEIDALKPGHDMDVLVCQVAGIEPHITWEVLTEDGKHSAFSSEDEQETREVFVYYRDKYSPWGKYHVGTWQHYPQVSTDDAAALVHLLHRLIQFDIFVSIGSPDLKGFRVVLTRGDYNYLVGAIADSLAMALCRAFLLFKLPISGEG